MMLMKSYNIQEERQIDQGEIMPVGIKGVS